MNNMPNLKISLNTKDLEKKLEKLEKDLDKLPQETYKSLRKILLRNLVMLNAVLN